MSMRVLLSLPTNPTSGLAAFAGVFVLMAAWELMGPRRKQSDRTRRGAGPTISAWWLWIRCWCASYFPPQPSVSPSLPKRGASASSTWSRFRPGSGWWPSVVILDLAIYLQHVLFHAVPALWRLHRMHHADLDIRRHYRLRFHPIEIVLSMVIKFAVVAVLGPPAIAVLIFEVLLNATSMFNHSNVRIPEGIDRVLRWFVVTPDMHRVHHSILSRETNSNFGFNLPWWDHLLGTYRAQPEAGHEGMTIGIEQFRDSARARARPHAASTLPWRCRPLSARASGG